MLAVRREDTAPEMRLRSALHRLGLRFRKNVKPIPLVRCKADVVFPRLKLCVFVDGCFWHGCPLHFKCPKSNADWWTEKIDDNRKRDERQKADLKAAGWTVLRFWEHEVTASFQGVAVEIASALKICSAACSDGLKVLPEKVPVAGKLIQSSSI